MTAEIELTRDRGVGVLTLNRPESLNSLSLDTIKALLHTFRTCATDPSLKVLVLTGAGRGFCAGWQLDESGVPGLPDESIGVRQAHLMQEYFNPVIQALHDMPIPTIASINGVCAGAGVSIALACDVAIASRSASFVLTFAPRLGLIPDLGATWKLPRLIGWARAQAVTMLGDRIAAEQAEEWGMIWQCVADERLSADTEATARRLAATPPGVCREVRLAYHAAQANDAATQMDYERLRQRTLLDKPSFNEGLKAFREKRTPNFAGATT
jgi:2-(1,2-epoxy-1,2-dihydrophenyl)acetyl-CoA isomerase